MAHIVRIIVPFNKGMIILWFELLFHYTLVGSANLNRIVDNSSQLLKLLTADCMGQISTKELEIR